MINLQRELFGLFSGSKSSDKHDTIKPKLHYNYKGLVLFYHFYKKETLAKINKIYDIIGNDCLKVVNTIVKSGNDEDSRAMTMEDRNYLFKQYKSRWISEAKSIHNYNVKELLKYGLNYNIALPKDKLLLGINPYYDSSADIFNTSLTMDEEYFDPLAKYSVQDFKNTVEPINSSAEQISILEEIKGSLDKLTLDIDKCLPGVRHFYKCQDIQEDDKTEFDYSDSSMVVDIFYPISDQGEYTPGYIYTEEKAILELSDAQKQYIIEKIDHLILSLK